MLSRFEYAGLFRDDKLLEILRQVRQLRSLENAFIKIMTSLNSKADVQNINYVGGAGSTTAAQLQRRLK